MFKLVKLKFVVDSFHFYLRVNPHSKNVSGAVLEETFSSCGRCDTEVRELMCVLVIGESTPNDSH